MKIYSAVTMSGEVSMASNAKDRFTIGSELERDNANADVFTVWANSTFNNDVILGSSSVDIVTVSGNLVINPVATPPTSREGQLYYDSNLHALMQNTEVANVPVRIGRSLLVRAKNTDSVTLTKGMAVRIGTPQGANKTFVRALSVNIPLTGAVGNQIIGIINDDIAVNSFGYATTFGELENLNTTGLTEGNEIYVSSTTSGSLTGSRPIAPNEIIPIGICISSHATQGKIFVKSRDPLHFGDITGFNPDTTSLLDGQVIRYISSNGTWGNSNSGVKLTGSFSGSFVGTTISASSGVSASVYYGDGSKLTNISLSQAVTSSGGQLIINSELVPSGNINVPADKFYKINSKKLAKWNTQAFTTAGGTTLGVTGSRLIGADFSEYGEIFEELGGLYLGRTADYGAAVLEADYIKLRTDYTYATPLGIDIINGNGAGPADIVIDNKSNGGNIYIKSSGADSSQRIYLSGSTIVTGQLTASSGIETTTLKATGQLTASSGIEANALKLNGSQIDTAWENYTPSWTATTTNPSIGNGSLTGQYKQIGKTVFVRVRMIAGSTTTFGTGSWRFSLPVSASAAGAIQFPCSLLNEGVNWYAGIANGVYAGLTDRTAIITTASPAEGVDAATPFTWGDTDQLMFNGSYEAA